ncbi:conserved membrane hypothetical protein [Pseudomonas sp. 8AS]|uniref:hypothetical protein n=1 Tax=Pseudomonas sp. 8AS TaxID=2653163 RepID=UPI0012F10BAA|nr:hypothetical protein [Pseudomonas sp. 8AS]VXC24772.1 conserved membrane hypothetical protein [Pseudomonas sp. 8AS]
MQPENPYAAPQVALLDTPAPRPLSGWSVGQLQLLGWLSLVSLLGSLVVTVLVLLVDEQAAVALRRGMDALSLATVLLGSYLLLRLKVFAEQRFEARGLAFPVWAMVLLGLLLEGLDLLWGEGLFNRIDWRSILYFAVLVLLGIATLWLGIRLLQVPDVYPVFRVMAWMDIVGGGMLASVLLMVLAILPLLGGSLCMMLVFFRAAAELRGQSA